jgi:hypothetical protein
MKQALIFAILSLFSGEAAMAQGVAQSPTTTVTQQRQQNGALVNGSPSTAISTNPQNPNGSFRSPFSSPFGTSGSSQTKGGYSGNK